MIFKCPLLLFVSTSVDRNSVTAIGIMVLSFRKSFKKARVILAVKALLYLSETERKGERETGGGGRERRIYFKRFFIKPRSDSVARGYIHWWPPGYKHLNTLKILDSQRDLSQLLRVHISQYPKRRGIQLRCLWSNHSLQPGSLMSVQGQICADGGAELKGSLHQSSMWCCTSGISVTIFWILQLLPFYFPPSPH